MFLDFFRVKKLRKYAPKRTKLHHSKENSRGNSPIPQKIDPWTTTKKFI